MCCIIHRPKDAKEIDSEYISQIIIKNPHGWGISYINDDKTLFVQKSIDMSKAKDAIRIAEESNREFLFHARWATHGEKNLANCHPFEIHNGVMFHNGRIDVGIWNKIMSDSWHFANIVSKFCGKKGRSLDSLVHHKYKKEIGESRLAFLYNSGRIIKYGKWHDLDGSSYSKLDWQYKHYRDSYWDDYGYSNSRYYRGRNVGGNRYGGVYDSYVDKRKEKSDREILVEKIFNIVKGGFVRDSYIETLNLDEIETLCDLYPKTMGKYLFETISLLPME